MDKYIIFGAGGFGKEIAEYLYDSLGEGVLTGELVGFLDDTIPVGSMVSAEAKVLGSFDTNLPIDEFKFLIGLGDPRARANVYRKYKNKGAAFQTLIHPSAYMSSSGSIEEGSILCPFSFFGSCSHMEQNSLLNIYSSVGHDCKVGAHTVLSPYATLNGNVTLNSEVFIGTKAVITKECILGQASKVAAASVVYNDVPDGSLAFGNPARIKKTI
ncbi:NeuD/PglB/VioB family sugar acetyltransferase [Kiloniella antarctica]|uniref:NeuD/PglB/VioB family sugar acetyltransferase n=1 Tax=Kiloniella antarctica TaxID=1550907 RepID=A0ABW5BP67_9PROT